MNIILPYEDDIEKSVESLDDKSLRDQIKDCVAIYEAIQSGKTKNNIVAKHYSEYLYFVAAYGLAACNEYFLRFNKFHIDDSFYMGLVLRYAKAFEERKYEPAFFDHSKRTIVKENVSGLYKDQLVKKWEKMIEKGNPPKWTRQKKPEFFRSEAEPKK